MSAKKSHYRRPRKNSGKLHVNGRLIALVVVIALLITSGIVFIPRLVHRCDNCDKLFVGTGYYANVVSNTLSSLQGNEDKILCRDCAETNHALEILAGKSLEDFRRPLFESDGD